MMGAAEFHTINCALVNPGSVSTASLSAKRLNALGFSVMIAKLLSSIS
jgi:hypothetical protein